MLNIKSKKFLNIRRTVRFGEIDSAGVIHFHHLLRWCHESWEESIKSFGINTFEVFPETFGDAEPLEVALPIIHCEADFLRPIKNGQELLINLSPMKLDGSTFQVLSNFRFDNNKVATGLIRHVAINSLTRKKCNLPKSINLWIEAASANEGISPAL